jgi:hypothetical protein
MGTRGRDYQGRAEAFISSSDPFALDISSKDAAHDER